MTYNAIKEHLLNDTYVRQNTFQILQNISQLVNQKKNEDKGRELLIRALDKREFFKEYEEILFSLVRTVGLFPYLSKTNDSISAIDAFSYEMHRPLNIEGEFVFHSMQFKIYQELLNGKNIVLSASTSVGKSLIIDALIASQRFKNIVLVVPTIALIDETRHRLTRRFRKKCKLISHPSQIKSEKQINIFILTQERVIERTDLSEIDIFVIDEFYKLDFNMAEDDRGIALNLAFYKLLQESKQFFLIGPNIDYVTDLGKLGYEVLFIPSAFSTVAVNLYQFNYSPQDPERDAKLLELCKQSTDPVLIYCQSPPSVNKVAELMLAEGIKSVSNNIVDGLEWIKQHYSTDWVFYKALESGIGIHHAGIPRALQQYCLARFNDKSLKFLICTSTIIEGVNTVAKNVIVYDKRKNTRSLDYFTYKNIEGRAGRMGQYFVGNVYSLEKPPEKTASAVDIAIASQGENTPVTLLLNMNEDDLTESSLERIKLEIREDILSTKTVKENLSYKPEVQYLLAEHIRKNINTLKDVFDWKAYPTNEQLKEVCILIYGYLEGSRLKNYQILSGVDLDRHVKMLMMSDGIDGYMNSRIETMDPFSTISETIENSLKIVRNVFCFSFPRALRTLDSIQREVLSRNGIENSGDFNNYASNVENLKMDPILFALDEFGIPLQTVDKLKTRLEGASNLDQCLALIQKLNYDNTELLKFEKQIIDNFKNDHIGG